jgi:hypothetical protein
VLKYTYALGYYMAADAPERPLFEHLQQQLEASTEKLSELAETPVDKMNRTDVSGMAGASAHTDVGSRRSVRRSCGVQQSGHRCLNADTTPPCDTHS